MRIPVVFSEAPNTEDFLITKRIIFKGDSNIYKICSQEFKRDYVLKTFPKTNNGIDQYHKEKLAVHLNHPSIIEYIPTVPGRNSSYLIMEYSKYGNFSDILYGGPLKNEIVVRTYFHQLIEGIEYIHCHGFVHLDLKLENLVLGSDFRLKIIDFGKSRLISDITNVSDGILQNLGSAESSLETQKKCTAIDVFAAGVILFAFRTAESPFLQDESDNSRNRKSFAYFLANNKKFWRQRSKTFLGNFKFSKEFIELVNGMLNPNPDERPTIQEIKDSEWYKGPVLNLKDLEPIMKPRFKNLKEMDDRNCLLSCLIVLSTFLEK